MLPILNETTLIGFETRRRELNYIPGFRDISTIGSARVELIPVSTVPDNYRFDITVISDKVITGDGIFTVAGNNNDTEFPYRNLIIGEYGQLIVYDGLTVTSLTDTEAGLLTVNGSLELGAGAKLTISNDGAVVVPLGGTIIIEPGSSVNFDTGGKLIINGTLIIDPNQVKTLLSSPNVEIGELANIKINEPRGARLYAIHDYICDLNRIFQSVNSTGSRGVANGSKASFSWLGGNPSDNSHILGLSLDRGECPSGDFTLRLHGHPDITDPPEWVEFKTVSITVETISQLMVHYQTVPTGTVFENGSMIKFIFIDNNGNEQERIRKIENISLPGIGSTFGSFIIPKEELISARQLTGKYYLTKATQSKNMNLQVVSSLTVQSEATLLLTEYFRGDHYFSPEIYIGKYSSYAGEPGQLTIKGKMIIYDKNRPASEEFEYLRSPDTEGQFVKNEAGNNIIVAYREIEIPTDDYLPVRYDRGGTIKIEEGGELHLTGEVKLLNADGNGKLIIEGNMFINDLSQLCSPPPDSIIFGPKGKLVVWNPSPNKQKERRELLSIPTGIISSELYRLFRDRLRYVEFHVQNRCGIRVDKDSQRFDLWDDWYGGMRLARAIADKYIVWHDGGYIELNKTDLPWVVAREGLGQATVIFKSFESDQMVRTQELADRLKFAGCGNIVFRFVDDSGVAETMMFLDSCHLLNVGFNPVDNSFSLIADNEGTMFIRSHISSGGHTDLLHSASKMINIPVETKRTTFQLL